MNIKMMIRYVSIFLVSLLVLTGCGNSSSNGGDGTNSSPVVNDGNASVVTDANESTPVVENNLTKTKGYLIDSPLQGVTYICDGAESLTDVSGMFECVNAPVTFKVGGLTIGTLTAFTADGKVYPQDLLGLARTNFTDSRLKLLARLLQSFDDDDVISSSINITQSVRDALNVKQKFEDLSESDIQALLDGLGKSFVSELDAINHLKESLGVDVSSVSSAVANPANTSSKTYKKSVSIKSIESRIIAYELEIHCLETLPTSNDINVDTSGMNVNGRVASVLGINIDDSRQNIKIAVVSSGTEEGIHLINKAIEFNGCTDASVIKAIVVDSSANQIDNPEITISE